MNVRAIIVLASLVQITSAAKVEIQLLAPGLNTSVPSAVGTVALVTAENSGLVQIGAAANASGETIAIAAGAAESNATIIPVVVAAEVAAESAEWLWLVVNMPFVAQLLSGVSAAVVVKSLCMAGNVVVQVSPFPQARRWSLRRDTGESDAAPYVSIAASGWQWCFYGTFAYLMTQRSAFLILVHSNCLGAVLGTYYSFVFYQNCNSKEMLGSMHKYLTAVVTLVLLQACALASLPSQRALLFSGLVASFCSFVGACSLLVTIPTVIRNRDSRSIPFPLVSANFLSAIVWCMCGYMLGDPLVIVPNIVAATSSLTCVILKLKYDGESHDDEDDTKEMFDGQNMGSAKRLLMSSQSSALYSAADLKQASFNTFDKAGPPSPKCGPSAFAPSSDGTGGTC